MDRSILAIIPARGGSKAIKRKNLVMLAGVPLIAYTLQSLTGINHDIDHIVSTEDEEISSVARQYGGRVPFLRPVDLAQDDTNIIDVIKDILATINRRYDYLLLLQPTAPLRTSFDVDAAIDLAFRHEAASVCSFMSVTSMHPWYMYYLSPDNRVTAVTSVPPGLPRQNFPPALWRNGSIYLVRTDIFLEQEKFITADCVPYLMPPERSVNIDSIEDLQLAEYYLLSHAHSPH